MIEFDDLWDAYLATRKNKRRSEDSVIFEMHLERNLTKLLSNINERNLQPTAYTFIATRPRPREVFACMMELRIIHHYIDKRIRPLIEIEMTNRSFNNRIGKGTTAAIDQVCSDLFFMTKGYTKEATVVKIDLSGYFPNASQDIAYKQLVDLVKRKYHGKDKEDLYYMIQISIYSYPTKHCYRKSPLWKWADIPDSKSLFKKPDGIGGAIGHLIWQNEMNYYLNDIDHWVVDNFPSIRFTRFVDDMVFILPNEEKEVFLATMMPEMRKRLQAINCKMNEKKFYCQPSGHGFEFLGTYIKHGRTYLSQRIIRNSFIAVHNFNKCVRFSKIDAFLATVNSYLGLYKTHNEFKRSKRFIESINPKWWEYCYMDWGSMTIKAKISYRKRLNMLYGRGNVPKKQAKITYLCK